MKNLLLTALCIFIVISFVSSQDSLWNKTYDFNFYNNHDLRISSDNFISVHRFLNDEFNQFAESRLKKGVANVSKGVFSFATTYLTMLWSHEMGHYIRAKQVDGKFNIHNFGLPVPYTTADLPEDITLVNEAIFVTAGFEVNYLNVRKIQSQFISNNGAGNEDLALAFANRLMYPIYTTLIIPRDPSDPNVWIETAGDPVHYILPVFDNFSNGKIYMDDGSVNPDLVQFYNQASIFATFFNLLDPQFYRELGGAFGKSSKERRPIFLIGNHENGWTYGTSFNASPLGYELYMNNYIHIDDRQFGLYLKYGRPFKNNGVGIFMNDMVKLNNFILKAKAEFWQQDLFGNGGLLEIESKWLITKRLGINFILGYKSEGYALGKQLESGFNAGIGLSFVNFN